VKIDPKDPQNVAIEWEGGSTAALAGSAPGSMHFTVDGAGGPVDLGDLTQQGSVEALKQRLKSIGQRGEGTVTEVVDTGMSVGENKLFVTSMTVTVTGKAPYTSKSPSLVAPKRIAQLVVGAKVPVWVDPSNPDVLLADWDDPAATHAPGS
jgi:hypothetical protein